MHQVFFTQSYVARPLFCATTKKNGKFLLAMQDYCRWGTFDGLNICSFSAIKIFTEILSRCLGHHCSLYIFYSTIIERRLRLRKNFCGRASNLLSDAIYFRTCRQKIYLGKYSNNLLEYTLGY